MAVATVALSFSITSCGGDDNNGDNDPCVTPPSSDDTATEATYQAGLYVSEDMMKYFDIVVTDQNGNATKLTTENTELVTDTVFGFKLDKYRRYMQESNLNATDNRLRLYTTEKATVKTFPYAESYSYTATPHSEAPAEGTKIDVVVFPDVDITNNSKTGRWYIQGEYDDGYRFIKGIAASRWDTVKTLKGSMNIELKNANTVSGEINALSL